PHLLARVKIRSGVQVGRVSMTADVGDQKDELRPDENASEADAPLNPGADPREEFEKEISEGLTRLDSPAGAMAWAFAQPPERDLARALDKAKDRARRELEERAHGGDAQPSRPVEPDPFEKSPPESPVGDASPSGEPVDTGHYDDGHGFGWTPPPSVEPSVHV